MADLLRYQASGSRTRIAEDPLLSSSATNQVGSEFWEIPPSVTGSGSCHGGAQSQSASGLLGFPGASSCNDGQESQSATGQLGFIGSSECFGGQQSSSASGTVGTESQPGTDRPIFILRPLRRRKLEEKPKPVSGKCRCYGARQTCLGFGSVANPVSGASVNVGHSQYCTSLARVLNPVVGVAECRQFVGTMSARAQLSFMGVAECGIPAHDEEAIEELLLLSMLN